MSYKHVSVNGSPRSMCLPNVGGSISIGRYLLQQKGMPYRCMICKKPGTVSAFVFE